MDSAENLPTFTGFSLVCAGSSSLLYLLTLRASLMPMRYSRGSAMLFEVSTFSGHSELCVTPSLCRSYSSLSWSVRANHVDRDQRDCRAAEGVALVHREDLVQRQSGHLLHGVHLVLPNASPKDLRENAGCFYSGLHFRQRLTILYSVSPFCRSFESKSLSWSRQSYDFDDVGVLGGYFSRC